MIVEGEGGEESPVETSKRTEERARYILVKNHVREVRDTDQHQTKTIQRKRKRKDEAVSSESTRLSDDVSELRKAYEACREVMEMMETKYGALLGEPLARCTCLPNRRIRFDESGAPVDSPLVAGDLVSVGRVTCDSRLTSDVRTTAARMLRDARGELADTLRYERRGLVQRVRLDPLAHVAFVGTNLHTLPGYCSHSSDELVASCP